MFERLFEFIGQFADLFVIFTVLDPYQGGLVLRLGLFNRELKPGLNWLIPFKVERIITEHVVPRTSRIHSMCTTTKDGKTIGFEAVVTWRIHDLRKSLLEVSSLKDAIEDCCSGIVGSMLSESSWDDIQHGRTMDEVAAACRKQGFKWGVEVVRVQLTGVAAAKNIRLLQDSYSTGVSVEMHGSGYA